MTGVRYDTELSITTLYPLRTDGLCACGCGEKLTGRRTRWARNACTKKALDHFFILKGCVDTIRKALFKRDKGICARCQQFDASWEAHHTIAVSEGGGRCGLEGYETLCRACHKIETKALARRRAIAIARGEIIIIKHEWTSTTLSGNVYFESRKCTRCKASQYRSVTRKEKWRPKAKPCKIAT